MQIQSNDCYKLDVKVSWLDSDQLHLNIVTSNFERGHWVHQSRSLFLSPEELSKIADHINDTLCR